MFIKLYFRFILLMIIPVAVLLGHPKKIDFENISLEQGLSQASVNTFAQDRRGFVWIGTHDGLNRYDGYGFKIYRPDPVRPGTISGYHIRVIIPDKDENVLWIGTDNDGLNRLDLETETFTHFRHNPYSLGDFSDGAGRSTPGLSEDSIYSLYQDNDGKLWIGTWGGGLNILDKKTKTFTHYRHDPNDPFSISHDIVRVIYEDKNGVIWIGTYGGGLNRFDRKTNRFYHYRFDPGDPNSLCHDMVMSICETRTGELWIGTDGGGISVLDRQTGKFHHWTYQPGVPGTITHNMVRDIHEDRNGTLWIGTFGGGLNSFDYEKRTFKQFRLKKNGCSHSITDQVMEIFEDNTDIIWLGTRTGGFYKMDRLRKEFFNCPSAQQTGAFSSQRIRTFAEDGQGRLWIGTNGGGLNCLNRETGEVTVYNNDPAVPGGVSHGRVYALLYDSDDDALWIGTFGGGLDKYNITENTFSNYRHQPEIPESISHNRVRAICKDQDGTLWFGTWGGGINKFNPEDETFKPYKHSPSDPDTISHDKVYCLYPGKDNRLWIGTWGGALSCLNRKTDHFSRFLFDVDNPNSISSDNILCVYETQKGILWIGTGGRGLNKYDIEKKKWSWYSSNQGLPSDVVYGILEDEEENLWLSTNKGLVKFNPSSEKIHSYDSEDGLQSDEYNGGAYLKNQRGEMFFGGIRGFNYFFPSAIKDNPYTPPVIITGFNKYNKPVNFKKELSYIKEICLSYKDNYISFNFVALNYRASASNRYAYKLEGVDTEWVYCGKRTSAGYTNLSGGTYVFKVRGANNDGLWNEKGASIKVIITPPFWQRIWFWPFVVVIALVFAFSLYKYRTFNIRNRNKQLESINNKLNEQISRRKKVERALRKSEEKFRKIYEDSIDVHYRADTKGRFIMISPSGVNLLGYDHHKDIVGKNIAVNFYFNPADREDFLKAMKKRGKVINYEVTLKRKDGKPIVVESNSRFVYDDNKKIVAVEGIFRDITVRKRAELENLKLQDQLLAAKKMEAVGTLAGGMAHEFNNLMATIVGNADLLKMHCCGEGNTTKRVDKILNSANRCAELTNQLLSFSRKQMLQLKKLDLNGFVMDIRGMVQQTVGDSIRVSIKTAEQLDTIKVDSEVMIQVIMGIVHNARDAMPEGGTLTLQTEMKTSAQLSENHPVKSPGRYVCLSISDTGTGMDEEILPHIFEPFFTTKAVGKGTGLDLSFVYGTIRQHNGWIGVESSPGNGATFTICLPAVEI